MAIIAEPDTASGGSAARQNGGSPARTRDPFAAMVEEKWRRSSEELAGPRRDYWINLAFYLAEQWIWWDKQRNVVQPMAQHWSPLGPGRVRLTVNRLGPNLLNLMGRLLKNELIFEVTPSDSATSIVEGARRAEKALESTHREQVWESARFDEVLSCFLGGTSATILEWDGTAGTELEFDAATDQVTGTGDVNLRSLNINEFGLEPGSRTWRDSAYCMTGFALPPRTIQETYKLSWTPTPDAMTAHSSVRQKLLEGSGRNASKELALVLCYYEPPRRGSKGQYAIVVNNQTVHRGPWPFPFTTIPLRPFRQKRVDGRWFGTTLLNDVVPIQVAYNQARSVLAEHMKLAGNARLVAPWGAFEEEDLTDNAGSILFYAPDLGGAVPNYLAPPNLPRWLTAEAENLKGELDDIMLVHDISRGQGFDRASGQALALLAEKDDSPLGSMAFEQRAGWQDNGTMTLECYKHVRETRKATLRAAPGISESTEWNGQMLQGQTNVTIPLDSVMPHTHAARLAFAKDLWDRKIITDPRMYARMVGLPPDEFEQLLDADAASANRENLRMAMGAIELPQDFEDHAVHISEHNRWRKSDAYKYAPEDVRKIMDDHIKYHEQKAHQEFAKQFERAKANPAFAALPQADEPVGSNVPLPEAEQQALAMQQAMAGGGGGGQAQIGPGGTTASLESDTAAGATAG